MSTEFVLHPYDWVVRVFYLDLPQDGEEREIASCLSYLGYDGKTPVTLDELFNGKPNMGMTYSDTKHRRTVVVIGRTTNAQECANTIIHERLHLAMHICKTLGIDPFSEQSAYLSGDIGAKMYKSARVLLCNDCRKRALRSVRD